MVYVGLLGGAAYVNICYIALNSAHIADKVGVIIITVIVVVWEGFFMIRYFFFFLNLFTSRIVNCV